MLQRFSLDQRTLSCAHLDGALSQRTSTDDGSARRPVPIDFDIPAYAAHAALSDIANTEVLADLLCVTTVSS
jgi:hypothetical protein